MRVIEAREWTKEVNCAGCTSRLEIEFPDIFLTEVELDGGDGEFGFNEVWECCVCGTRNPILLDIIPPHRPILTEEEWFERREKRGESARAVAETDAENEDNDKPREPT